MFKDDELTVTSKPLKIAVIGAKGLPPHQGGIEQYCSELYQRLAADGSQIDVFARSNYTRQKWFGRHYYRGIRIITLPCSSIRGTSAVTSSALAVLFSSKYDIVHFHALGPALFCWFPKLFSSARVIVTCHGLDWKRTKWGQWSSRLIRLGEYLAVHCAHDLVVVSQELEDYFVQEHGRTVVHIPNAPPTYSPSAGTAQGDSPWGLTTDKYVLFLGRLVPEKCPDILIQAFQQAKLQGWKLAIVGGQSDTSIYLKKLLGMTVGDDSIVFTGELKGSHLADVVRQAGLFVLPSSIEGLPLAMLEAMNEGIPVVASHIPPHEQLVGKERGLLFKPESVEDCAEALKFAIAHPELMQQMANRARLYVRKHHTWTNIIRSHQDLFKTANVYRRAG